MLTRELQAVVERLIGNLVPQAGLDYELNKGKCCVTLRLETRIGRKLHANKKTISSNFGRNCR